MQPHTAGQSQNHHSHAVAAPGLGLPTLIYFILSYFIETHKK